MGSRSHRCTTCDKHWYCEGCDTREFETICPDCIIKESKPIDETAELFRKQLQRCEAKLVQFVLTENQELKKQKEEIEILNGQIDFLNKHVAIMTDALKEIAEGPHEGEGFCYDIYGYRTCSCHVRTASDALKNCEAK
jgi:hypothetical protein